MNHPHVPMLLVGLLLLGGSRPAGAGTDDLPPLEGPVEMLQDDIRAAAPPDAGPLHEALRGSAPDAAPVRVDKAPPMPIVDGPRGDRPDPSTQWVEGYWAWDEGRKDFTWVAGTWLVPPDGMTWVSGQWKRDDRGWHRVPGSWTVRPAVRPAEVVSPAPAPRDRIDWRTQGPPADRPVEAIGPAPGPDYFVVPGGYVPDGDDIVWKPGFWARVQPGWEWVPARWVRQSNGWAFREGRWVRVPTDRGSPARDTALVSEPLDVIPPGDGRDRDPVPRHVVSRPAADATRFPSGETAGDPRVGPGPSPWPSDGVDPADPRFRLAPNRTGGDGLPAPFARGAAADDDPGPAVVGYDPGGVPPWPGGFPPPYPLLGPPDPRGGLFPGDGLYYLEVYRGGRRGPLDRVRSIVGGVLGGRRR